VRNKKSPNLSILISHIGNSLQYLVIIREINESDIDRGFLDALSNLLPTEFNDKEYAKGILQKIKSNLLHKIFVAEDEIRGKIAGTTTLLVEPKFINKGMKVGYIEDVAVSKEYERLGIGSKLVTYATNQAISIHNCKKVLLYTSPKTRPFYENLGYKIAENTVVMIFERLSERG
jgi:glucosamine-phosphate N-acetyltransferase